MKHLGDITQIDGSKVPVVDCVIGGSPCQDLSIAGKRAGLAGERSGLYMDQIRVIKEMRANDRANGRTGEFIRPRYMVWENVPGSFSSNKGKDFAAVLEEAIRVIEPEAPPVPVPEKGWPTAFYAIGSYHSNAWKSDTPNSMSVSDGVSATRRAQEHGHQPCVLDMTHANDVIRVCGDTVPTLQSRMGTGGNQVPLVYGIGNGQTNQGVTEGMVGTLNAMHDQQAIYTPGQYNGKPVLWNWRFRFDMGAAERTG